MNFANKCTRICVGLAGLVFVFPASAYDAETHALITYQAYNRSLVSQTVTGSIVSRLGLDRLDIPKPLTLPPLHVSLAECFNSSKENGNGKEYESALHAGFQV